MRLPTLLAVVVACGAVVVRAGAPVPVVTTLDSAGDVGRGSDVARRADGRGFVAYQDESNARLKVASCQDLACTSALIGTLDPGGPFDSASVAIGPSGRPVVAYRHTASASIRVAHCADLDCTAADIVTLVSGGAFLFGTDLVIGADGLPLVLYGDETSGHTVVTVAHCEDAGCASRTLTPYPDARELTYRPVGALGADGRVVFASAHSPDLRVGHCSNLACTAATFTRLPGTSSPSFVLSYGSPSIAPGGDGRMALVFTRSEQGFPFPPPAILLELRRCADVACTGLGSNTLPVLFGGSSPIIGVAPGDRPAVARYGGEGEFRLSVRRCTTSACPPLSPVTWIDGTFVGEDHAMALSALGDALLSYDDAPNGDLKVAWLGTEPEIAAGDTAVVEGASGRTIASLQVSLSGADDATVDFTTADGTATAGVDYLPTSGTLTFAPGSAIQTVTVSVLGDLVPEADETFRLLLSNAQGAPIVDGEGIGRIVDDEPHLSVADVSVFEGDAGTVDATFTVSLDVAGVGPVTADFTTDALTATAGVDYLSSSGSLSFAPGETSRTVVVSVVGDLEVEPDETFRLVLFNWQGALMDDNVGLGTLRNDDAPEAPILAELRHGAAYAGDLAAQAGPTADEDVFRIAQEPFASYEVVVDAVSGDAVPLALERRDAGASVVQSGTPVGTGTARSLRWRVAGTAAVNDQTIRVAGTCGTACGDDDVYRVRAYETTLRAPRFNNSGTQTTLLVLHNPGDTPIGLDVRFWDADGALVATHTPASPLAPHGVLVLDTSGIVPGAAGSLTVAHDAPYGGLAGKSVALEPATGFSFDTPLEPRRR